VKSLQPCGLEEPYRATAICSPESPANGTRGSGALIVALRCYVPQTDRSVLMKSPRRQDLATKAYILVKTKSGRAPRLAKTIRCVPEVESADLATGVCDLIVVINAPNLSAVADLVIKRIQATDSVVHITTCLATTTGRST
jgi:DNA-binding Lrp family transcriptional regulator